MTAEVGFLVGVAVALLLWLASWHADRRDHSRKLEALQRRIRQRESATESGAGTGSDSAEK